jgi:hypothetical protein
MARRKLRNGLVEDLVEQDGKLWSRVSQPGAGALYDDNQRRIARGARKNSLGAEPVARVPEAVRVDWKRKGRTDLLGGEVKALNKWFNSSEGRVWSQAPRGRSRAFSKGGI